MVRPRPRTARPARDSIEPCHAGSASDRISRVLDASERGCGAQLRIGVVGAGFAAQVERLPLLAELADRFVLAGVADPDRARRRTVAARYGIPDFAAHEDLLAARELDAVVVCSPDATHAEVTVDALAAGLHVL